MKGLVRRKPRDVAYEYPHAAVEIMAGRGAVADKIVDHHVGSVGPGRHLEKIAGLQRPLAFCNAVGIGVAGKNRFQIRAESCSLG